MKLNLHTLAPRILTVVLGLLLAAGTAEIGLRLIRFEFQLYPAQIQFGYPDPVTMQRLYQPDKDLFWVPHDYGARVTANAGQRPSLVFMGCSCTQFGVYDRFVAENLRAQCPSNQLTFVNMGIGGWTTYQGLQQLKRDVLPMQPHIITIYYGWNDHWCTFGAEDLEIATFHLRHPILLNKNVSRLRVIQAVNKLLFSKVMSGKTYSQQRVPVAEFRANLRAMVRLARAHAITPVLLTAPSSHQVGQEPAYLAERWLKDLHQLVPLHAAYVQAVRDVAAEEQVDLVDLFKLFKALPPAELDASFQRDGIHLTETGDRHIAGFLGDYFAQHGLLAKLASGSPVGARNPQ
jgi:lysophospholipase L1-like esterase